MNNIPANWQIKKLGEYVISVKGKKPKRISPIKTKEYSVPYVNIKAFEKNVIDEYTDGVGCALCEDGDFLMVWDGSRSGFIGKAIKGALGSTLVKLNFPNVENNYAYYFLQSKFIEINTRAKGVGIPHVDPNLLWNYQFPIPPLPEQQAIVSKIEELFSELDNGKQQLLTAQQQLKVYRQSLLKWAFEGKLTSASLSERDTASLSERGSRWLSEAETTDTKKTKDGELPKGWKWVKFNDFCKLQRGYDLPLKDIKNGKYPVVTSSGIHGYHNEFRANGPCLITGRSGGVGNIHFLKVEKYWPHNTTLFVKDFCNNVPGFAYYFFLQFNFKSFSASTTIPTLDRKQLYNELVKLPPIEEQRLIVDELESKLTVCDKIEETIANSLQQAEALRQSILKKAFEGKLI